MSQRVVSRSIRGPARTARSGACAPPNPQASAALTTPKELKRQSAREPRRHRHDLAHDEERESRGQHTRTASAIWMPPPALAACCAAVETKRQHQRGDQHGEDRDEGVVRELRDPGLEEALGGLEEEQRDEERPQGQQHRERDPRECKQEHGVDRGDPDDQVHREACDVVREIAVEDPALLQQERRRIAAGEDDLIDDPDRVVGADDARGELRRRVEEGVDDDARCRARDRSATPRMTSEREDALARPR